MSLYWIPRCHDNQSHSSKSVVCLFQDMTIELKSFAARPEHRTSDSTFLVLMSHGIRTGVCGKKYSEEVPDVLKVNTIFQILNTWNCPSLKDKPKVIIIQACRGGEYWCLLEHRRWGFDLIICMYPVFFSSFESTQKRLQSCLVTVDVLWHYKQDCSFYELYDWLEDICSIFNWDTTFNLKTLRLGWDTWMGYIHLRVRRDKISLLR